MGVNSESSVNRKGWQVSQDDSNYFLKPVKFSKEIVAAFDDSEATVATQCLLRLQKICESLQNNHVLITDRISFGQKIWDLHIYEDDPSKFPIFNVQIKCSILSTMLDLLRDHPRAEVSEESFAKVLKVLDYLRKLLEAAVFKGNTKAVRTVEKVSSIEASRLRRPNHGSLSYKRKISGPRPSPTSGIRKKETSIENINKFHEYKPLIVSLHHKLTFLNQSNRKNDIIFAFVLRNICKFILDDCKLLLTDYIDREILQI